MNRFKIIEEMSRTRSGQPAPIFYIRELPYVPGVSIQATATTLSGAHWIADRLEGKV